MTLERAEQIERALIDSLQKPSCVAQIFTPHSRLGVNSTKDILLAQLLCVAQFYRHTRLECNKVDMRNELADTIKTEKWKAFDDYVNASDVVSARVWISYVPDRELVYLKQTEHLQDDPERVKEWERVYKFNRNDSSLAKIESVNSFVRFLKSEDPTNLNYYDKVYARLDLPCPYKPQVMKRETKGCATSFSAVFVLVSALLIWLSMWI